ncbi:MAG: Gfo/Idh/MocA family oxidoreductase, partial [Caldilineaceae bacterium]|nr:Gfo/Idh/MocA family oxidoreductase [Caldilineaceae bacterium]
MSQPRTRYAIVGLGGRHYMFHEAILSTFADHAELVALCDVNPGRVALSRRMAQLALTDRAQYQQVLKSMDATGLTSTGDDADLIVPGYRADEFERMIAETRPDTVIVTTKDATHDDYICRAMELGCDVITEKPMTTDAEKCRRIL